MSKTRGNMQIVYEITFIIKNVNICAKLRTYIT